MHIALVLDPRFPGGTSSAVAQEISILSRSHNISVVGLETRHFKGKTCNPRLLAALDKNGIDLQWAGAQVAADVIVFHNPAALKFDTVLETRFLAQQAYIVAHENFLRPNGLPGFDVAKSLYLIDKALLAGHRSIAPVSDYNRSTVAAWLAQSKQDQGQWTVSPENWFNICEFETVEPTIHPKDRRGRISRVGFEKFPSRATMEQHFPPHAEVCAILGGDTWLDSSEPPPEHWTLHRFGAMSVADFFEKIDFFVYFTNPCLRESFGRVIPEAIAAGKIVITDPATAQTFGEAVIGSDGSDVDQIIESFITNPAAYRDFVLRSQQWIRRFSGDAFKVTVHRMIENQERIPSALL
jgi:hypothetical protein